MEEEIHLMKIWWWVLETAQAADFVREKEGQLDEPSGSLWSNFSGQRQWLTITACPFEEGPFLILDGISALDYLIEVSSLKNRLKKN